MSEVVVAGATVKCAHSGMQQLQGGSSKLTVGGAQAIVAGTEAPASTFTGCSFSTNAGPSPCAGLTAATSGVSSKLKVGGTGVLLKDASGMTTNPIPAGVGTWSVSDAGQTKLTVSS